ncbi:hypothetical protein KP509_04G072600 [Ceratopteris richardii]|uniref:CREG-like beta-barrel domain-containing protein n=1 Tax=Ceratopteris richardii TaxID=49495 RepID=A0A8T2UWQ9_CERRI|nr:hypothetical protein KP509_04G072600 [Ceratopteris richardii]
MPAVLSSRGGTANLRNGLEGVTCFLCRIEVINCSSWASQCPQQFCTLSIRRRDSKSHILLPVRACFSDVSLPEEPPLDDNNDAAEESLLHESNGTANMEVNQVDMKHRGSKSPLMGLMSGSGRAGLFRTPISGGVQSATSSHGLPPPALAVRNLMEQARFAHLCTIMSHMHHRRRGYPFGSLVDFAADSAGHPIFSLSPLAIHTRNLHADPRCTLVVQVPGWSGLSNARVTIFGDLYPLSSEQQEWAHKTYTAKHQQGATQQWGNFYYYRMETISDIYFIGGFGTVAWVDVKEFESVNPDAIAANGAEQTLKVLNSRFSRRLRDCMSTENEVDDAALISIDSRGVDVRVRQGAQFNVQRLSFDGAPVVETLLEAEMALEKIMERFQKFSLST